MGQLGIGGLELQHLELVRRLIPLSYEIYVCPLWPIYDLKPEYEEAGAKIICIHKRAHIDPTIVFRLGRFFRQEAIELVHTVTFTSNTWGRLAALWANVPNIVASERSIDLDRSPLHFLVDRWLSKSTDVLFCNSIAVRDFHLQKIRISPDKCIFIYNGVDAERFAPVESSKRMALKLAEGLDPNSAVVGTIANLRNPKDYATLLQAAHLVLQAYPGVQFVIIGDGPLRGDIKTLIAQLKLSHQMRLLGQRRDVEILLPLMDVFVLSTFYEGFSNAILEAMASALPVVATDVGGNAEAVCDGKTGYLIEPRQPDVMAKRILKLLEQPELARAMGQQARESVLSRFTYEKMVQQYDHVYRGLLGT